VNRVVELLEKLQKSNANVPSAKIVALQKVLQSDFFNAVREVYEHIYETIDGSNDPELRASATAKVNFTAIPKFLQKKL
jgi:hypothetical protein